MSLKPYTFKVGKKTTVIKSLNVMLAVMSYLDENFIRGVNQTEKMQNLHFRGISNGIKTWSIPGIGTSQDSHQNVLIITAPAE